MKPKAAMAKWKRQMFASGQNAKDSARANNFCFTPANGHYQVAVGWVQRSDPHQLNLRR